MSKFFNSAYKDLESYTPGEQPQDMQYVKLNTNESPYMPPKEVLDAINEEDAQKLQLYPDPECKVLKKAIAEAYGTTPKNVFVSNGSDDILNFAFMAFAEKGAMFADITYGFYPVFTDLHHIKADIIPLKEDLSVDINDYLDAKGKLICIANPNAPTGLGVSKESIEKILEANKDSVVLIDEAYVDFGAESCADLICKYDNLIVCMTYSKSRSMAGARLGFALAHEDIINDLETLKYSTNPYSVNRLTMKAGIAAFSKGASKYFKDNCEEIIKTREYTTNKLEAMGFEVIPSSANFIFAKHKDIDGGELYEKLKQKGVLVRHFTKQRIKDYNRITIGTKQQMDVLIEKTEQILNEVNK